MSDDELNLRNPDIKSDLAAVDNHIAKRIITEDGVDASTHAEPTHDQLPSVEEYKAAGRPESVAPQTRRTILLISVAILLSIICVTLGVVIGRDTASSVIVVEPIRPADDPLLRPDEAPVPAPVAPIPLARIERLTDLIAASGWSDPANVQTPLSPQWKAAKWIADEDPKILEIKESDELKERYAMVTFYFATQGNQWEYQLNFLNGYHICDWHDLWQNKFKVEITVGIDCRSGSSVVEIFIPSNGLVGEFPREMHLFGDLEEISLYENDIHGNFPPVIQSMGKLKKLILQNNHLNGKLPDWISQLTNLHTLNVAENVLEGEVPYTIGTMSNMVNLNLERNAFSGRLDLFEGMASLKALFLGDNMLTGVFDNPTLLSWPNIEVLDISDNEIEGGLPIDLFAQDTLMVLDLHGNSFSGELPDRINDNLPLFFLALHENALGGPIDYRFTSLTNLEHADLSDNKFTGSIPSEIGEMTNLKYLFLALCDQLTKGPIPDFSQLTDLADLSLQGTHRMGPLPKWLGDLDELVLLDLNDNRITGPIPNELGNLEFLTFLLLKNNVITGGIPPSFSNLGNLDKLILDDNAMSGDDSAICQADNKLPGLTEFVADCNSTFALSNTFTCACCTRCCKSEVDIRCNDHLWLGNMDPVSENTYVRSTYIFHSKDVVFPVQTYISESAPESATNEVGGGGY